MRNPRTYESWVRLGAVVDGTSVIRAGGMQTGGSQKLAANQPKKTVNSTFSEMMYPKAKMDSKVG